MNAPAVGTGPVSFTFGTRPNGGLPPDPIFESAVAKLTNQRYIPETVSQNH